MSNQNRCLDSRKMWHLSFALNRQQRNTSRITWTHCWIATRRPTSAKYSGRKPVLPESEELLPGKTTQVDFRSRLLKADLRFVDDSMVENGGGSESGESGGESATPKRPHMYLRNEPVRTLPFTSAWVPPKASPPLRTETLRGNVLLF